MRWREDGGFFEEKFHFNTFTIHERERRGIIAYKCGNLFDSSQLLFDVRQSNALSRCGRRTRSFNRTITTPFSRHHGFKSSHSCDLLFRGLTWFGPRVGPRLLFQVRLIDWLIDGWCWAIDEVCELGYQRRVSGCGIEGGFKG